MPVRPTSPAAIDAGLLAAARRLARDCDDLSFAPPVSHVYNPLDYAWAPYEAYIRRFGTTRKRIVMLGMNPGPFGMMQTGVPFGEVAAVRDWMGIVAPVRRPRDEHPKRPIAGFDCSRSEVSGRRLWGWAAETYGSALEFFAEHLVLNYCPLVLLEAGGRNRTPEQLPIDEVRAVHAACDRHLHTALSLLEPQVAIGIGGFAAGRLQAVIGESTATRIIQILHPSPASPAANRGWATAVNLALHEQGVFGDREG
jgi:single-strand selective monofunctional uracil DNA glycosylase